MFIYECKTPKLTKEDKSSTDNNANDIASFDIANVRNELKKLISTEGVPFFDYAYPINELLMNNSNDDDVKNIDELSIKEVISVIQKRYNQKLSTKDVSDNIFNIRGKIVKIKNLNSKKIMSRVDELCLEYKKVILMKPRLSNPIDETCYLVLLDKGETKETSSVLPTNTEGIIDFMYCMYNYGIYVAKLSLSVATNSNLTKIKSIRMTSEQEYKQYIKTVMDKIREVSSFH